MVCTNLHDCTHLDKWITMVLSLLDNRSQIFLQPKTALELHIFSRCQPPLPTFHSLPAVSKWWGREDNLKLSYLLVKLLSYDNTDLYRCVFTFMWYTFFKLNGVWNYWKKQCVLHIQKLLIHKNRRLLIYIICFSLKCIIIFNIIFYTTTEQQMKD